MKNITHIFYILIFVVGFTSCINPYEFFGHSENDVMVIIDDNGGSLSTFYGNYGAYILHLSYDFYAEEISLPTKGDWNTFTLFGYELNIDGEMYEPGTIIKFYSTYFEIDNETFDYPSDRTIIFKAIW